MLRPLCLSSFFHGVTANSDPQGLAGKKCPFPLYRHPSQQSCSASGTPQLDSCVASVSSRKDVRTENTAVPLISFAKFESMPTITAAKRVVLVRHGQSTWNEEGRIQGSSDISFLTAKGESQAETSRQMLLSDSFDVCYHSPLIRAKRTAEIIWGSRTASMVPIYDLREIDLYSFQGLMKNEGKEQFGAAYRTWQKDAVNFIIDGHYPVRELWARAHKFWIDILSSEASSILVVAHNAVNQALVATATGLGPEYFRQLLQSNCGVSVIDFTPNRSGDAPPYVCLERLNQTPSPPIGAGQTGGRKARSRVFLVCHGATDSVAQNQFSMFEENMNMLGIIQSRKTAELLLDVKVEAIFSSPQPCAVSTAAAIAEVQEAADCLGADCVPRYVEVIQVPDLRDMGWGIWEGKQKSDVAQQERWQDYLQHEDINEGESLLILWERAAKSWETIVRYLKNFEESEEHENDIVIVSHEITHVALLGHLLGLSQAFLGSFHLDTGSLSVIDFPDGSSGKPVVRCLNYTAHLGRWAVPITRPTLADEDF